MNDLELLEKMRLPKWCKFRQIDGKRIFTDVNDLSIRLLFIVPKDPNDVQWNYEIRIEVAPWNQDNLILIEELRGRIRVFLEMLETFKLENSEALCNHVLRVYLQYREKGIKAQ